MIFAGAALASATIAKALSIVSESREPKAPRSKEEMIQELNQLLQATKGAISYLESDMPTFPSTEPMKPNSFTVGNFLVTRL